MPVSVFFNVVGLNLFLNQNLLIFLMVANQCLQHQSFLGWREPKPFLFNFLIEIAKNPLVYLSFAFVRKDSVLDNFSDIFFNP